MDELSSFKQSVDFQKNVFRKYYSKNTITLPDRFGRREFAFIFFGGKGMMRHTGFEKKNQFSKFINEKAPRDIYYSSAYYKKPYAPSMQEKEWMGAELIFDLDSDHLPNAEKFDYEEQLKLVKKEFYKLVNDFLMDDFGFEEKYIELFFSGGRGYHCHVKDPKILSLDSSERREIVDYIIGRDLKYSAIFHEQVTGLKNYGGRSYPTGKSLKMSTPDEPGWKGRISRGIIEIINEIINSENPLEKLKEYGVSDDELQNLLNDLSEERINRIKEGRLDQSKLIRKFFLNNALRKTAVSIVAGETDEPVTCDIKRLIRLPCSLHGKTGFKVEEIKPSNLKDFDPLVDAVVLPEDDVNIEIKNPFKMKIKKEFFNLSIGKQKIPIYLAFFLIGRKIANII